MKAGGTPHSANNLLNNKIRNIRFDHLEKICILLNCTPNDLMAWQENAHTILHNNHPLKQMQHKPEEDNLYHTLRGLPLQELKHIAGLVHNSVNNLSDE